MNGHVEHDPGHELAIVLTCPRCGLDAGVLDPHDPQPVADAIAAVRAAHECPPLVGSAA